MINQKNYLIQFYIKMVLGLLKWLKGTGFSVRKKEINTETWFLHEKKFTLTKNEEFINFQIKEKLILWTSGSKSRPFSMQ